MLWKLAKSIEYSKKQQKYQFSKIVFQNFLFSKVTQTNKIPEFKKKQRSIEICFSQKRQNFEQTDPP